MPTREIKGRLFRYQFVQAISLGAMLIILVLACQNDDPIGVNRGGDSTWRPVGDCPIAEPDTSTAEDDSIGVGGVAFPNYHTGASWHQNGLIVFANQGTSCVDKNGIYSIDMGLRGIWILDPLCGTKNRIVDRGRYPSWSPDGKQIVFEYLADIYVVKIEDGSITRLTRQGENFFPAWSPDGERIAYDCNTPDSFGIWLIRVDGTDHHRIPVNDMIPTPRFGPSWNLNGDWLLHTAVTSSEPLSANLYEMRIDGQQVRQIVQRPDEERFPEYSRDGTQIVFQSLGLRSVPFRPQVWTMNADGRRPRQQTFCGGLDPSWSPDGTQIVYTKSLQDNSSEDGVLFIIDLRNGLEKQLTFQPTCDE